MFSETNKRPLPNGKMDKGYELAISLVNNELLLGSLGLTCTHCHILNG